MTATASERKWKAATVNRYKALLSLAYRVALENGKVQSNPVRLVRRLREDNAVIRYMKPDEETKLRAIVEPVHPERWATIVFALNTGLRAGEQFGLQWEDIDFEHNPPQLRLALTKNGSLRYIPLNALALHALDTVRGSLDGSGRVFSRQPYRMWFEIALKAACIEGFTWHCLRHTFASRLVMAGVDIRTVAELMGHRSLQMTMRYAHLAPEHKAAAVAKLETPKATDTKTSTMAHLAQTSKIIAFPQVPFAQSVVAKMGP